MEEKKRNIDRLQKETKELKSKKEMAERMMKSVHKHEVQKRRGELKRREEEVQQWVEQFEEHVKFSAMCSATTRELFVSSLNAL